MRLNPGKHRHEFPLVALDSLDLHFGGGFAFGIARLGQGGFGFFLCGVLGGAFAGGDREGGEVGV
jgi:hypothetical protein